MIPGSTSAHAFTGALAAAPPVADLWHVIHDGKEEGPLSLLELIEKAALGKIDRADLVKPAGGSQWAQACEIGSLQEQFRVTQARDRTMDNLENFHGIWISKKGLLVVAAFVLLFLLWGCTTYLALWRTQEKPTVILAPKQQSGPSPEQRVWNHEFDLLVAKHAKARRNLEDLKKLLDDNFRDSYSQVRDRTKQGEIQEGYLKSASLIFEDQRKLEADCKKDIEFLLSKKPRD